MATTTAERGLVSDRGLILGSLIILAAGAWGLLIWQSAVMDDDMSLTMGFGAPLFLALWVAMMVAIMYPTAAPMIMAFARVHNDREARGQAFVPTWVFAGSYLLLWSATGIAAYGLAVAGDAIADESAWVTDNAPRIGGGLLIAAGVYQLTPLKDICLSKCRTPVSFLLNSWREGVRGSFLMGLNHGAYCLGCCWLLFLILFPLGMMNIAVLAVITILIFAEKSLPVGLQIARAAGAAMVVYGGVVLFVPEALPMAMSDSEMGMMDEMSPAEMGGMDEMGDMPVGDMESGPVEGMPGGDMEHEGQGMGEMMAPDSAGGGMQER
jgi:predicted metal-binding membrane protein